MLKTYYLLTKPGIIFGNLLATAGAFLLASNGDVDFLLYISALIGLGLVIASACVFNNYIDREIDKKMPRTKSRALASGTLSVNKALGYGTILGIFGVIILAVFTNLIATAVAFFGFLMYVVVYSYAKRKTSYGTLVGSISGAVPPVVGYCAVTGDIDAGAVILFLVLVFWQMPHFYSIAMYKKRDYKLAGIPVLPVVKGNDTTKRHILLYIVGYLIAVLLLMVYGITGLLYLAVVGSFGLWWLWTAISGFEAKSDVIWAKKMFRVSLFVLCSFCVMISIEGII